MAGTITLYHYTTKKGKDGIQEDGVILESKKSGSRKDDARYGNGVYLTSLPPSEEKIKLALNNYDGPKRFAKMQINWGKVDCYVAVKLKRENVVEVQGDRDIFLYRGDLVLEEDMNAAFGDVTKK